MLQNRVDPYGKLICTSARGAWLGNRGVIHNYNKEIVRHFKLKAWITCQLSFKGRHREIMQPNRWTELFFIDEATAFAAGHRPCAECRRDAFNKFKCCWINGNQQHGFDIKSSIKLIDEVLHRERISPRGIKICFDEESAALPDGSFVLYNEKPWLVRDKNLLLWTAFGYKEAIAIPHGRIAVLTPLSIVNSFRCGYIPQMAVPAG